MNKNYQRNVPGKGKTIKLVFNDPKLKDYYDNFAINFADELFGAVEAGIVNGENSKTVLLHSLEYYRLGKKQVDSLCEILPYFVVEDSTLFGIGSLKEWLTIPHFRMSIPNCLKDSKRLTGFIVGILMLITIAVYGVIHFTGKATGEKVISQDSKTPAPVSVQTNTTQPSSKFNDLVVSNSNPVITSSAQEYVADATAPENPDAMVSLSATAIQEVRQLIINDDEVSLKSLFKNGRLLIEVGGFCSDYISEDCANIIQSGKIRLIYDKDSSDKLLKKIVITK